MSQENLALKRWIATLRWTVPIALGALTVFYEVGPGRVIHDTVGPSAYFDIDIIFYGVVVPLLTLLALTLAGRWIDKMTRAEVQAQASEYRLASIMSASTDAILGVDTAGKVISWNRGAELLFGYPPQQMPNKLLADLFGGNERLDVEFDWLSQTVQQDDSVQGYETSFHDEHGREIVTELTASRLVDPMGSYAGMSVIVRDVTERKRREEEILQLNMRLSEQVAERTRELNQKVQQLARANSSLRQVDQIRTELVSLVSHQIRAPLTNMRGAAERMQTNCGAISATCNRMFAILDQQIERLDRLVQDVLNTARVEAGEFVVHLEPISILPVVQQVADQIRARSADRPLQLPTKPGLPLVFADRSCFVEILANLLDNADKYSPPGAVVDVDVQADETEVIVTVRDHGLGLHEADPERLFEKFYRASGGDSQTTYGYGLGLYVCRRLVMAQGGRIWVENADGGGAAFSFALPVAT